MSFNPRQLRELIRQVLRYLEPEIPFSEDAVELLMLTAAQESVLGKYLVQIHGPARGIFQMEPATEHYVLEEIQTGRPKIWSKIAALITPLPDSPLENKDMIFNLAYATAIARVNYFLKPGKIPHAPGDMANYYKKYWNTPLGAATVAEALAAYQHLCMPV